MNASSRNSQIDFSDKIELEGKRVVVARKGVLDEDLCTIPLSRPYRGRLIG